MMGGMMGGYGPLGWVPNFILTIALIVGIVLLIIWLVRRVSSERGTGQSLMGKKQPKDILQERYVSGEISRDEYQQILADIG
jgi:uncharacterized membrane protein